MENRLGIYKLFPDVNLPKYATSGSACFDVCAYLKDEMEISYYDANNDKLTKNCWENSIDVYPGQRYLIPTGMVLDIPKGHSIRVHPRSGLSLKNGIILSNCEGVIDSDYVEQLYIILTNVSRVIHTINHGDKICQAELQLDLRCNFHELDICPNKKTDRDGGFGSTGE